MAICQTLAWLTQHSLSAASSQRRSLKTTVELPDELLERSRRVARREGATLKALIEEGLRLALRARERKGRATFRVEPFSGDGMTPEFQGAGWERIRDEIYRDRR